MKPDFPHASESFRKLNPHLFGVGGLRSAEPQSDPGPALDSQPPEQKESPRGLGQGRRWHVCIIVLRRRIIDGDNLAGGCKALRDTIARWLGCDDAERFIAWEYGQQRTEGQLGTVVKIGKL
jgi:predicted Fe-S protein YdhL (DUF1289 family)